jgi:DNA-binding beta-propeller fold protein YncE
MMIRSGLCSLVAASEILFMTMDIASAAYVTISGLEVTPSTGLHRYEYVFPDDGNVYVYDMDNHFNLVKILSVPPTKNSNVKGVVADSTTSALYISYGGDGGRNGNGSLLKYDLLKNTIIWTKNYNHGIDSMAITADGSKIYMPVGEGDLSAAQWMIEDSATGSDIGSVTGGNGPHNTVISPSGTHVYMGGRHDTAFYIRNIADGSVFIQISGYRSNVRPFTVDAKEAFLYTTHDRFLGFQVTDINAGSIKYTVPVTGGFGSSTPFTTPSHGVTLSPDDKELYLIDTANAYVHVFDISKVSTSAPKQVADIKLRGNFFGDEANCGTGWCGREGWVQESLDGRFVFVGDSGDVIDTKTRQVVALLPQLKQTRKMLEIDWRDGVPIASTSREGIRYRSNPPQAVR